MNHLRHAPEIRSGLAPSDSPVPVTFTKAVVKASDVEYPAALTAVPFPFHNGMTTRVRAFSPTGAEDDVVTHCQIAPDNAPAPPAQGEEGTGNPFGMDTTMLQSITVFYGDQKYSMTLDPNAFDLTKGIDVRYTFTPMADAPIGPLMSIDITPVDGP